MTRTIGPAPVKTRIDRPEGGKLGQSIGITEPWRKWFASATYDVERKANKVTGSVTGNIAILTSSGDLASGGIGLDKHRSVTFTDSATLTISHFGRVIKFNNGTKDVVCSLPSVGSGQIDSWITIMKFGSGTIRIKAADSDTIEKSSLGGFLKCNEPGRMVPNVILFLATETQWAILGGTGIWKAI